MQRNNWSGLVVPALAALALAIGGLAAPDVAHAGHFSVCAVDNPVREITTIGKGQRPSNNEKVAHTIVGNIVDPRGQLGPTSHRISLCNGTPVTITITDTSGGPQPLQIEGLTCSTGASVTCSGLLPQNQTLKYVTRSLDGTDTDRMSLLSSGDPPLDDLIGSHKCVFDSAGFECSISGGPCAVDSDCPSLGEFCVGLSRLEIFTQLFAGPLTFPLIGSADVDCGVVDPATGKGPCDCTIQDIAPITIGVIGNVCVNPATEPCDPGEIDCDGGNALDIEVVSDHNIGACSGQANCMTSCQTYCGGMGLDFFSAGCEGFCTDGTQQACTTDDFCAGVSEGSCSGPDGATHGNICGCNCDGIGGSPSRAGGLLCELGADIKVVPINRPCTDPPSIDVGEACIPITTETASVVLHHAGNGALDLPCNCSPDLGLPPFARTGTPSVCPLLASSITAPIGFEGFVDFFDSALGDLVVSVQATCQ